MLWVTGRGTLVNRGGTGWLARRFVDPSAGLRFIQAEEQDRAGRCSFETAFDVVSLLGSPAHGAFSPEAPGLRAIAQGFPLVDTDDERYPPAERSHVRPDKRLASGVLRAVRAAGAFAGRLAGWIAVLSRRPGVAPVAAAHALPAYVALSRQPGWTRSLDARLTLLAGQLAAELSGCGWCIERGRHECRAVGLSPDLLGEIRCFSSSQLFTPRDRAALEFVEAVARAGAGIYDIGEHVLGEARQFFSESEIVDLTGLAMGTHGPKFP